MASIIRIVLILMPFVIYFIWLRSVRQRQQEEREFRNLEDNPIDGRLGRAVGFAVAAALAVVIWIALANEPTPRDARYVPPHTKEGVVVPGGFVDLEKAGQGSEK